MISDIQAIDGYENMTTAEIAAALATTRITRNPIDLGELMFLLNDRGMLTRTMYPDADGVKWSGTVVNMLKHVRNNAPELVDPVNKWFSHITFDKNDIFDTSLPQYGAQLALLAENFAGGEGMPTVADFDAMAELGGGWKFAGVTEQDVADALSEHTVTEAAKLVREQANMLYNAHVSPVMNSSTLTIQSLVTAMQNMIAALQE